MMKTKRQLCFVISNYHFSDDDYKLLSIERRQVDCNDDEFELRYDTIQTSVENDVSHITGSYCVKNHKRPQSPDFEELYLEKFEVLFSYKLSHTPVSLGM